MSAVLALADREPLPASIPVEQALLGAVLSNNAVLHEVAFLTAEHFAEPVHGRIFDTCRKLVEAGKPASPVTLWHVFEHDGGLAEVGGPTYLGRLAASLVSVRDGADYARTILDCWQRREGIQAARTLIERLSDMAELHGAAQAIGEHGAELDRLAGTLPAGGAVSLVDRIRSAAEQSVAASKGAPRDAIETGIAKLDEMQGGMEPGQLCIVAARPSMGKSSMAVSVALNVAQRGKGVAFFSLEMTATQLAQRALAAQSGVPFTILRRPGPGDAIEIDAAARHAARMADLPFWVDETEALTLTELRGRAASLHRRHGLGLLVVDHIGLMRCSADMRKSSMVDQVGEITSGLKAMAKRLRLPVMALCQLNRGVEGRDDKRPTLADLRASGRIEEDADQVLFLYREEYYVDRQQYRGRDQIQKDAWASKKADAMGKAEVLVAKNRDGQTGAVEVAANMALNRWGNLERGYA